MTPGHTQALSQHPACLSTGAQTEELLPLRLLSQVHFVKNSLGAFMGEVIESDDRNYLNYWGF